MTEWSANPSYKTETMTLEELVEMRHQLVRDWPPGDGIPFPEEILEVLEAQRVEIVARDAARQCHIEVPIYTVQVVPATKAASKKAEKKCRLCKKRAAANKRTSADADGTVSTPIATTAPTLAESDTHTSGTTPAPAHLAIDSTKPNTSVLDPRDSISTTTNSLVHPTTAMAEVSL